MDNNLFIEGIPDELQPGVFVRRINGKELNGDEMIEYYTKKQLIKQFILWTGHSFFTIGPRRLSLAAPRPL